jgi:hypothetical protein
LYIEIYLKDIPNAPLIFEKNSTARLYNKVPILTDKSQTMEVPDVESKKVNLKTFFDNAIKYMGNDFWTYKFDSLNCQDEIKRTLAANGLLTSDLNTFILQDMTEAVKTLGETTKTGFQALTDADAIFRKFTGRGLNM